jgi:hypothetical protein
VPEQPSRSVEVLEQASSRAGAEQLSWGVGARGRGPLGQNRRSSNLQQPSKGVRAAACRRAVSSRHRLLLPGWNAGCCHRIGFVRCLGACLWLCTEPARPMWSGLAWVGLLLQLQLTVFAFMCEMSPVWSRCCLPPPHSPAITWNFHALHHEHATSSRAQKKWTPAPFPGSQAEPSLLHTDDRARKQARHANTPSCSLGAQPGCWASIANTPLVVNWSRGPWGGWLDACWCLMGRRANMAYGAMGWNAEWLNQFIRCRCSVRSGNRGKKPKNRTKYRFIPTRNRIYNREPIFRSDRFQFNRFRFSVSVFFAQAYSKHWVILV